ncbi:MAG: septation regulator SpoVG [Clostridia bacterium]|nr:septation regulator SpoVG [Clostridia bacterium]
MEITDIRIRKVDPAHNQKMKAVASITFDDMFVVHDIKIIEGSRGLFVDMPSRRAPNGEYKDIAHPINSETRLRIQAVILEAYKQS